MNDSVEKRLAELEGAVFGARERDFAVLLALLTTPFEQTSSGRAMIKALTAR